MPDQPKMFLRALFPTFLHEAWYPGFAAEKEQLIRRIREIREEDQAGREYSAQHYPYGFTSFRSRDRLYTDPAFRNLVDFMFEVAYDYGNKQYWNLENFELAMTQLWCNINSRYNYHRDHVHPYSQISGVFYIQCESDAAPISLKDPRPARWMVPAPLRENRAENTLITTLPPEEGKLLMFPAWLDHGVAQHHAETDRISMSYNFELRQKNPG
ncbi:MAG: hypothetical protein F4Y22_03825 [Gammaproteobacteria bacterium]|nr:hypothetical protein [Gammaproteobacteria bacterium]MYH47619.1 hypothetical protein [Gammaproteobacteria bacterium]MYL12198.1 hypothetical protein [Gammaproteobacteria bacterium]